MSTPAAARIVILIGLAAVATTAACGASSPAIDSGPGDGDAGPDGGGPDGPGPDWEGTTDPTGSVAIAITASRQVARIPADDAPASDSEVTLTATAGAALVSTFWQVSSAELGTIVLASTEAAPTFRCPVGGRGTYDVSLKAIGPGDARVHLIERRLITCTLPRTDAGRTVHRIDLSVGSTFYQQGRIGGVVVMPGDLIRVRGAARTGWQLIGFVGTRAQPIHIINDGLVTNTDTAKLLQIVNSQHLIVDGLGSDDHPYGFVFANATATGEQAVFVRNYTLGANPDRGTTDLELFGLHVARNPNTGIEVLTGPGSAAFNRDNFALEHLLIHHNLVENVGDEGFYIGYNNDKTAADGFAPFQIHGAKIFRNVIRNTQWDGLQVANCSRGLEVHDNHVSGAGRARMSSQQSAFQYNSGNSGWIYRNQFLGAGSELQTGCTGGDLWVFGNVFDRVDAPAGGHALYIHGGQATGVDLRIFANTFRTRGGTGVNVNTEPPTACDGTGLQLAQVALWNNLFVFPDGNIDGQPPTPYRRAGGAPPAILITTPNLVRTETTTADLCWKSPATGDYRPGCTTSAALDGSGTALPPRTDLPLGVFTDHLGRAYLDARNHGAYQSPVP